jgi:hypothetical protein
MKMKKTKEEKEANKKLHKEKTKWNELKKNRNEKIEERKTQT